MSYCFPRSVGESRKWTESPVRIHQEPHVFNPDDDDFGAVAAVHALAAEEEGWGGSVLRW